MKKRAFAIPGILTAFIACSLVFTACPDPAVAANLTPAAGDFDIGNLSQTAGSVTAVTVTPKTGKSGGAITVYYEGADGTAYVRSATLPSAIGSYAVTFDVAAATGWNAAKGLAGGTLIIDSGNTWIEFNNMEIYPVTVYSDPARQIAVANIAALGKAKIAFAPNAAGAAFYPVFHLFYPINGTAGITVPYNGGLVFAAVEAGKTNAVPIPRMESVEINSTYIMLVNSSNFSLTLREGSSDKSPIGGGTAIINSGSSAAYEASSNLASQYSVIRNPSMPVPFPSSLTELKPGLIYVFTYDGTSLVVNEMSLLQTVPPAVPENFRIETVSSGSVRLAWDIVSGATSYRVYRAAGMAAGSYSQVAATAALSWTDTSLLDGHLYFYKVGASSGTSLISGQSEAVFAIMPVANVHVTDRTTVSIALAWDAVTGANGYNVYRSGSESGAFVKINTNALTGTVFNDASLSPDTDYFYKVSAIYGGVEGLQSNIVSTATLTSVPANVRVTDRTTVSITLAWDAVIGASSYNVYRSGSEDGTYNKINAATITGIAFTDTGVLLDSTNYYKVCSINGGAEGIRSNLVSTATLSSIPANVRVREVTENGIMLEWDAVTGVSNYNIYRSTSANGTYTKINTEKISSTGFTDYNIAPYAVFCYYKVSSVSNGFAGLQSSHAAAGFGFLTVPGNSLVAKLTWLQSNAASNMSYFIKIDTDESIAPQTLSYSGKSGIIIALSGNSAMRTVFLSSSGTLFEINTGVTLVLNDNITLNGRTIVL